MRRRIEYLISDIREEANSPSTSDTKDGTIIRFLNSAQDRLASLISAKDLSFLGKEGFLDVVSGTKTYTLPVDILGDNKVLSVERCYEYSPQERNRHYFPLEALSPREQSKKSGYFIQRTNLVLVPTPDASVTSGIRINYPKKPHRLDKRRGTISSLAPFTITGFDTTVGLPDDLLTIVDANGVQVVTNIANGGFNTGTGVITTTTSLTGAVVGQFVLLGGTSTTHSELPDKCEDYLVEAGKLKVFHKDSSDDKIFGSEILVAIEQDLLEFYGSSNNDSMYPAILNSEYMDY